MELLVGLGGGGAGGEASDKPVGHMSDMGDVKCKRSFEVIFVCSSPFRYGQLSGMVEPIAGLFGTVAVVVSLATEVLLRYLGGAEGQWGREVPSL